MSNLPSVCSLPHMLLVEFAIWTPLVPSRFARCAGTFTFCGDIWQAPVSATVFRTPKFGSSGE